MYRKGFSVQFHLYIHGRSLERCSVDGICHNGNNTDVSAFHNGLHINLGFSVLIQVEGNLAGSCQKQHNGNMQKLFHLKLICGRDGRNNRDQAVSHTAETAVILGSEESQRCIQMIVGIVDTQVQL